tara:strand:+ start:826 stop:1470 length:645 start_codon:yes stop_codon:yes gene_type:complete
MARLQLKDIMKIHSSLINNLKAQKVRQDKLMQQYYGDVKVEMNIPTNRYSNWTRFLTPFAESVITGKIVEGDLLTAYEDYLNEVITIVASVEAEYEYVESLANQFDLVMEALVRAEKRIMDLQGIKVEEFDESAPKEEVEVDEAKEYPVVELTPEEKKKVRQRRNSMNYYNRNKDTILKQKQEQYQQKKLEEKSKKIEKKLEENEKEKEVDEEK